MAAVIGNLNKEHGGAQQLLYDVFSSLPDEFEPIVYFMFGPGTFREDFERAGVEVHHLGAGSHTDLGAFRRLVQRLRWDQPQVIHTNSPISGVWGRFAASLVGGGPRIVSVEHSVRTAYRFLPRLVNGITLPLADAVVGVSDPVVESLFGWEGFLLPADTEVLTITNGIDVERFAPSDVSGRTRGSKLIVGSVGRLTEAKGYDRLVRAWPRVVEEAPEAVLRIVGDGNERDHLEALAARLGVSESVTFAGYRKDPAPEYRRFHLAVFPSRWEGFGLTVGEAMASEVPVIASDIPPFRRVVGSAGILVPGENTIQLARAVVRLLNDHERRLALAAKGRERIVERFSIERTAKEYAALYRRCANE